MAGWAFRASGNATDKEIGEQLHRKFKEVLARPDHGTVSTDWEHTDRGWRIEAHGDAEDLAHHKALRQALAQVLGDKDAQTGSSEIQSPHVAAANFHDVPEPAPGRSGY